MTALHWAAYNNTHENVKILLKAVSEGIGGAVHGGGVEPQWFVVQGADIVIMDVDGKTALHWTASNPDDTTAKTLLVCLVCVDVRVCFVCLCVSLCILCLQFLCLYGGA